MNALDVLCAQLTRDLFAIAKFLLTIGRVLLHCWYSLGRPVTISRPIVLSVFDDWYSVPFVKNSQKTVKTAKTTKYTKPRKRRYLAKPPSHVPGQWPQPVARGQG